MCIHENDNDLDHKVTKEINLQVEPPGQGIAHPQLSLQDFLPPISAIMIILS